MLLVTNFMYDRSRFIRLLSLALRGDTKEKLQGFLVMGYHKIENNLDDIYPDTKKGGE